MQQAARRRMYMCSECGKTFRTPDDMYLHAEVCLLDAFEMEANALLADPSLGNEPDETSVAVANNNAQHVSDYQGIFRPYYENKRERPAAASVQNNRVYVDEAPYSAPPIPRKTASAPRTVPTIAHNELMNAANAADGFDDEDYDAPPQLELAEPQAKKYKRIFPIGEDGKQIRPKMECPTCGLVLYRHNFSTHYRIHTGELPFQCSFCDKRFRTSSALTVHTRCHTGDKPYMCPHCEYSCITKRNLDRHIINNHVKRTRRSHFIKTVGGATTFIRRRGRPPAMAQYYDDQNDAQADGLDDVVMQLAMQHDPENQQYSLRRRRKRKHSSSNRGEQVVEEEGVGLENEEEEEEDEEAEEEGEEEVVTYHVTQEEMEQLMRAAEAEGVIIQHEDEVQNGSDAAGVVNDDGGVANINSDTSNVHPVKNEKDGKV